MDAPARPWIRLGVAALGSIALASASVAGCSSSPTGSGSMSGAPSESGTGASGSPVTVPDASSAGTGSSGGASGGTTRSNDAGSVGSNDSAASMTGAGSTDAGQRGDAASAVDASLEPYKGLASFNGCTDVAKLGLSWYYNWTASTNCASAAQFAPQIWGHPGEDIAGEMTAAFKAGYPTVLGFNEPDNTGQSNISVANAITMWPALTSNPAIRIGSPATQANTTGQTWFTSFMDQVNADTTGRLRVDFIAIHWYGWNMGSCEPTAATLDSYLKWAEAIPGNRPIWLTEWACSNLSDPTAATVQSFLSGAIAMFAKHPRLERYGWFTSRTGDNNGLVNADAGLTPLGVIYADAPSHR